MRILSLILVTFICISPVYALSTTLASEYAQGETIIIEINGPINVPLSSSDMEFLRGHVQVGSFEYDLKRLGDRYFIYAIAPFIPHNYTLALHDVQTTINGQPTTLDFFQNFTITNNTADYTLRPGFALTGQDVELEITLHTDVPQQITFGPSNSNRTLTPGLNTLELEIEDFDYGLYTVPVGVYDFMLYSTHTIPQSNQTTLPPRIIEFSPVRFDHRFRRGSGPYVVAFFIENTADHDLSGFDFVYDDERFEVNPSRLRSLDVNETVWFNITVLGEDDVSEIITISIDDEVFELPLEITFEDENATNSTLPSSNVTLPNGNTEYSCREYNGFICLASQQCSGETVTTSEGACCRGTCVDLEEKGSLAWLGYMIGFIVLFLIVIVGGRYLKARSRAKSENPLDKQVKKLERPF